MGKIKSLFISIDPLENRRRLLMHLDAARSLNWNIFVFTSSGQNNSKQESDENIEKYSNNSKEIIRSKSNVSNMVRVFGESIESII